MPAFNKAKSSNISLSVYSLSKKQLVVRFKSGAIYRYKNVPKAIWEAYKKATSKGKYFHRNIRTTFSYDKLSKASFLSSALLFREISMNNYTDTSDAVYYRFMEDFIRGKAFDTSAGEVLRKHGELVNGTFRKGSKVITVKDGKVVNVSDLHTRADPRDDPRDKGHKKSSGDFYDDLQDAQMAAAKLELTVYALIGAGILGFAAGKKLYAIAKNKRDAIRKARRKGYRIKEAGLIGAFVQAADGCYYAK